MDFLVLVFLALSLCANAVLATLLYKRKSTLTVDAKRLLNEITKGPAVIKIEVLDTAQLFLRSPRG